MVSTTSSPSGSTGADTSGSVSGTFIPTIDVASNFWCNYLTQDCPPGQKCNPCADDGGSSWNSDCCVPVVEDPVQIGEPCYAESGVSGIDNCDLGLMCWDVDAKGDGTCVALCKSGNGDIYCEPPGTVCAYYGETLGLCLRSCDPLAQDCDPVDVCIPNPTGLGFLCVLDASGDEGQQHDPCMYANACDPGLWCADVTAAVECDLNAQGCCQPFCDLTDPEADAKCGGVGQVCVTYFDGRPDPEHDNVGYCAVPE